MTVFMTKTWGFQAPCGPLQFSKQGWRDRARQSLKSGDLVAIVGTLGDETDEGDRGRLLGLMEPTNISVNSLDYKLSTREEQDFDEKGNYRWPFGLELCNAWQFREPRVLLTDISSRSFGMDSAQGIVPLLPEEADAILVLPRESVSLLRPIRSTAKVEGEESARKKAAPPPTTTRTGIMHMRRAPAYTYAMTIEGSSVPAFKVGWAFDFRKRERQFNHTAMPPIGGLRYRTLLHHLWDTAVNAFQMERALLKYFDAARHTHNPEVISCVTEAALNEAWIGCLTPRRRRM